MDKHIHKPTHKKGAMRCQSLYDRFLTRAIISENSIVTEIFKIHRVVFVVWERGEGQRRCTKLSSYLSYTTSTNTPTYQ